MDHPEYIRYFQPSFSEDDLNDDLVDDLDSEISSDDDTEQDNCEQEHQVINLR